MINLIFNNKINCYDKKYQNVDIIKSSKHFPSSTREWKSSIFLFNKNNLNLIPVTDLSAINIVKSYFLLFNKQVEENLRTRRLYKKYRRSSLNKIYISNGEFKHTNKKVIINIYIYNRQNNNYLSIIKIIKIKLRDYLRNSETLFLNRLKDLKKDTLSSLFKNEILFLKNVKNNRINNYIKIYIEKFCKKVIDNEKNKRLLYWYYKRIKYINQSKFTYNYLQYLKEQLSKLYNKEIEFNVINLKRFYLNSDILLESITKKITKTRKKTSRYLRKLKSKIRIRRKNSSLHKKIIKNQLEKKINATKTTRCLSKIIIKNLKYRHVTGFKLEARGRLTKRYTASRSMLKVINKGNLLNIDSSFKKLSSVLLKGNLRSNLQYTKLASKSRIGSFGIKGWISGY